MTTPAQLVQQTLAQFSKYSLEELSQQEDALTAQCSEWSRKLSVAQDAIQAGVEAQKRLNSAAVSISEKRKQNQRVRYCEMIENPAADLEALAEGGLKDIVTNHEVTGALQVLVEEVMPAREEDEAEMRAGLTERQAALAELRVCKGLRELHESLTPIVAKQGPLTFESPRIEALKVLAAEAIHAQLQASEYLRDLRKRNEAARQARMSVGAVTRAQVHSAVPRY